MSHLRSKITIPGKTIWNMNDATKRWETDSKQKQDLQKCGRNFILTILMSSGKIRAISCFLSWKWKKISSVPFLCEIGFQVMHHVWITWYCCHPCCYCCCCCHCWCCSWPWKLGFVSSCYPFSSVIQFHSGFTYLCHFILGCILSWWWWTPFWNHDSVQQRVCFFLQHNNHLNEERGFRGSNPGLNMKCLPQTVHSIALFHYRVCNLIVYDTVQF